MTGCRRSGLEMADCPGVVTPISEAREFVRRFVSSSHEVVHEWASLVPVVDTTLHAEVVAALRPDFVECIEGFDEEAKSARSHAPARPRGRRRSLCGLRSRIASQSFPSARVTAG